MKSNLKDFREVMHQGMITNFEHDGYLTPILFFFKDGQPIIGMIPPEMLNDYNGKEMLASIIKKTCQEPNVFAAGIIMEAYGAKVEENSPNKDKIISGEIRVSELDEKQDIIVMLFSTPENEELIVYEVDCDNKKVGNLFNDEEMKQFSGLFTNFFSWNKN